MYVDSTLQPWDSQEEARLTDERLRRDKRERLARASGRGPEIDQVRAELDRLWVAQREELDALPHHEKGVPFARRNHLIAYATILNKFSRRRTELSQRLSRLLSEDAASMIRASRVRLAIAVACDGRHQSCWCAEHDAEFYGEE